MAAIFDFFCPVCKYSNSYDGLDGRDCPLCGSRMYLKPYKVQMVIPNEQSKKKLAGEKEADSYFAEKGKEEFEYKETIRKIDEEYEHKFYGADFHNRMAEECKGETEDVV